MVAICLSAQSYGQVGVTFHQSVIPSVGVNKQIGERFLPELRIGVDNLLEDTSFELDINFLFIKKTNHEVYAGIGGRTQLFEGLVIPLGVNCYPFENKNFGFHVEMAALLSDNHVLRGSWGVRIRLR